MKKQSKRIPASNYYIEPLVEDDFLYEVEENYDEANKHPNWDQRMVSFSAKPKDSECQDSVSESPDFLDFSFSQDAKLALAPGLDLAKVELLKTFLDLRGNIFMRAETGLTAKQQRKISKAIRQARANRLIACKV